MNIISISAFLFSLFQQKNPSQFEKDLFMNFFYKKFNQLLHANHKGLLPYYIEYQ